MTRPKNTQAALDFFFKDFPSFLAWQKLYRALLWMNMRGRKMFKFYAFGAHSNFHEWSPILNDLNILLPGVVNPDLGQDVGLEVSVVILNWFSNFWMMTYLSPRSLNYIDVNFRTETLKLRILILILSNMIFNPHFSIYRLVKFRQLWMKIS